MTSFLGKTGLTRGLRNNNVGNIKYSSANNWLGKVPFAQNTDAGRTFEQFKELKYGIRAMIYLIVKKIGSGYNTIEKLIGNYAPPSENNTKSYIDSVAKSLGIPKDKKIEFVDFDFILQITKAIIKVEIGNDSKYIADSDILDACDLLDMKEINGVEIHKKFTKKFNIFFLFLPLLLFFYTVLVVTG